MQSKDVMLVERLLEYALDPRERTDYERLLVALGKDGTLSRGERADVRFALRRHEPPRQVVARPSEAPMVLPKRPPHRRHEVE